MLSRNHFGTQADGEPRESPLGLGLIVLSHPGVDEHIRVDELQERSQRPNVNGDCPAGSKEVTRLLQVWDPDRFHTLQGGTPVKDGVGERHASARRGRLRPVVDHDPEPFTVQEMSDGRPYVAKAPDDDARHAENLADPGYLVIMFGQTESTDAPAARLGAAGRGHGRRVREVEVHRSQTG